MAAHGYPGPLTGQQRDRLLNYILGYLSGLGHLHAVLAGAASAGIIPPEVRDGH